MPVAASPRYYDAVIVHAAKDKDKAITIKNFMNSLELDNQNHPRVTLYTKSEFHDKPAVLVERCSLILVLLTEDFIDDENFNFLSEESVQGTRLGDVKNWQMYCVRQLHTQPDYSRFYRVPPAFASTRSYDVLDLDDEETSRRLKNLFQQYLFLRQRYEGTERCHGHLENGDHSVPNVVPNGLSDAVAPISLSNDNEHIPSNHIDVSSNQNVHGSVLFDEVHTSSQSEDSSIDVYYDAIIVHASTDKAKAETLMDELNSLVLDGNERPKVRLYDKSVFHEPGSSESVGLINRCSLILVLLTDDFIQDKSVQFLYEDSVEGTRLEGIKGWQRYCVRTLHTLPKTERSYTVPAALKDVRSYDIYDLNDILVQQMLKVLFQYYFFLRSHHSQMTIETGSSQAQRNVEQETSISDISEAPVSISDNENAVHIADVGYSGTLESVVEESEISLSPVNMFESENDNEYYDAVIIHAKADFEKAEHLTQSFCRLDDTWALKVCLVDADKLRDDRTGKVSTLVERCTLILVLFSENLVSLDFLKEPIKGTRFEDIPDWQTYCVRILHIQSENDRTYTIPEFLRFVRSYDVYNIENLETQTELKELFNMYLFLRKRREISGPKIQEKIVQTDNNESKSVQLTLPCNPAGETGYFDAAIIFAEADRLKAKNVNNFLNSLTIDGHYHPKVCLYRKDLFLSNLRNQSTELVERCTFIFLLLTGNFEQDESVQFIMHESVQGSRYQGISDWQRYCLRPLHSQPIETRTYTTPRALQNIRSYDMYDLSDKVNQERMKELFQTYAFLRKRREREYTNTITKQQRIHDPDSTVSEYCDAIIVHAPADLKEAKNAMNFVNSLELTGNQHPRVQLYETNVSGPSEKNLSTDLVNRCSLIFILLTDNFASDENVQFLFEDLLEGTRFDQVPNWQMYCVRPLHTKPVNERKHTVPLRLQSFRSYDISDHNKPETQQTLKEVFQMYMFLRKSHGLPPTVSGETHGSLHHHIENTHDERLQQKPSEYFDAIIVHDKLDGDKAEAVRKLLTSLTLEKGTNPRVALYDRSSSAGTTASALVNSCSLILVMLTENFETGDTGDFLCDESVPGTRFEKIQNWQRYCIRVLHTQHATERSYSTPAVLKPLRSYEIFDFENTLTQNNMKNMFECYMFHRRLDDCSRKGTEQEISENKNVYVEEIIPVASSEYYDAVIFHSELDKDLAMEIRNFFNSLVLENNDHPKVCLYEKDKLQHSGNKVSELLNQCSIMFVLLTDDFELDENLQFLKDESVPGTRLEDAKDWRIYCVRPLHTQPKMKRFYPVPTFLESCRSYDAFDFKLEETQESFKKLFQMFLFLRKRYDVTKKTADKEVKVNEESPRFKVIEEVPGSKEDEKRRSKSEPSEETMNRSQNADRPDESDSFTNNTMGYTERVQEMVDGIRTDRKERSVNVDAIDSTSISESIEQELKSFWKEAGIEHTGNGSLSNFMEQNGDATSQRDIKGKSEESKSERKTGQFQRPHTWAVFTEVDAKQRGQTELDQQKAKDVRSSKAPKRPSSVSYTVNSKSVASIREDLQTTSGPIEEDADLDVVFLPEDEKAKLLAKELDADARDDQGDASEMIRIVPDAFDEEDAPVPWIQRVCGCCRQRGGRRRPRKKGRQLIPSRDAETMED